MKATEIPVSKELIQGEVMNKNVAKLVISSKKSLDKDSLNSVIISLRPCIKQAKVHIIHNLTKQIAMLKKKKTSNEQQKNQNDRKINRFVEEISILKRTSKDVIGRWLLSNKKTLQEVTKDETLSQKFNLRLRVFARTGDHKVVRNVIEPFRLKYPSWEKEVPKIMIRLGKKRKKVDPNTVELGIKPVRDVANVSKKLEDESDTEGTNSDTHDDESTISDDEGDDEELFVSSLKEAIKETIVKRSEDNTQPAISPEDGKEQGESVVKVFDLEHDTFDQINSNKSLNNEQENKINKKVSSFFVGGESDEEAHGDSDYEDDFDNDLLSNQDDIIAKYRGKGLQMKERGSFQSNGFSRKNTNPIKSTQNQPSIAHSLEKKTNKEHVKLKRLPSNKSSKDDSSSSSLHPSWAAKKRANISIAKFEGKKIKFGDEINPVSTVASSTKSQQDSEEKLHPSWTAKQNLKSSIQTFQGKKTLFED